MRKAIRVSLLVLALASATYAGDIPFGSPTPPPPPPPQSAQTEQESEGGWMPNGEPESATEIVLTLINSALSLL